MSKKERKEREKYRISIKKQYEYKVNELNDEVQKVRKKNAKLLECIQTQEEEIRILQDWNERLLSYIDSYEEGDGAALRDEYEKNIKNPGYSKFGKICCIGGNRVLMQSLSDFLNMLER